MFAVEDITEDNDKIMEFLKTLGLENDFNEEQLRVLYERYDELFNECTLSTSVSGKGNSQAREFLKEILRNLLESGLE